MNRGKIITLIDRNKYNFKVKKGVEYKDYTIKNQELIAAAIKRNDPNITIKQGNENHEIVFDYNMKESDYSDSNILYFYENIQPIHPRLVGYCPLTNVGNSCYMNSAIQLLYSIPQLRDFFNSINIEDINQYNCFIPTPEQINNGYEICQTFLRDRNIILLNALKKIFYEMKTNHTVNISNIKGENIYNKLITNTNLIKFRQEDTTEFMVPLISALNCFIETQQISNTFVITQQTKQICSNNEYNLKNTREPLFSLPLNGNNIQELITNYTLEEEVPASESNLAFCYNKGHVYSRRQTRFLINDSLTTLIFSIKRFNYDQSTGSRIKLNNKIDTVKQIRINNINFLIQGIIIHSGDASGGHYVYLSFNENGDPHTIISDSSITPCNNSSYFKNYQNNGYVYYYKRI